MSSRNRVAIFTLATVMAACGGDSSDAADVRFYPIKSFTLVSTLEGMNKGSKTMHVTDWGRKYVTIEKTTMSMMGITRTENKRVIVEGRDITTIDEDAKTITKAVNPMYDNIAKNVEGKGGVELGRSLMVALGHKPTGERGSFAGESCEYWSNPQFGQKLCATDDGIVLSIVTNMMGMNMSEVATEVRRGDAGPDSAYDLPDYPVSQAPNIQDLLNRGRQ